MDVRNFSWIRKPLKVKQMIKEKLFTLNRFTRKFIVWYYSKRENGEWRSKTLRELYKKYKNIDAGHASYGWAREGIDGPLTIGKYASIGGNVRRISVNHPINGVTTHPCWFNPTFNWVKKDFRNRTHLKIGNDVWIGDNVTILPGCEKISDGSVIAAGAVLTKDVGAYEIWAGVPAKCIKKRFDDETIQKLQESEWWNLPEDQLKTLKDDFSNPDEFLSKLQR